MCCGFADLRRNGRACIRFCTCAPEPKDRPRTAQSPGVKVVRANRQIRPTKDWTGRRLAQQGWLCSLRNEKKPLRKFSRALFPSHRRDCIRALGIALEAVVHLRWQRPLPPRRAGCECTPLLPRLGPIGLRCINLGVLPSRQSICARRDEFPKGTCQPLYVTKHHEKVSMLLVRVNRNPSKCTKSKNKKAPATFT